MNALRLHGTTGKFTWRMLATVLGGQSLCILLGALVARGVTSAADEPGRGTAYLVVGIGLFVLSVLAAGSMRKPYGLTLGWAVQALTIVSALVVPMMLVVGLFFLALWVTCLVKGASIDAEMARREREASGQSGGEAEAGEGAAGAGDPADRVDG
ncbi:DUF4233 domain-containing protein [Intrasporangium flavum]|uniref:DUF4233 domain-containing protein n=1 Tax=Intrasporangium flavum TaxID=1428657 RepID=UPI00096C0DA5|nr:DUF4233 domain-containing protein [Intrasporangium flavum]